MGKNMKITIISIFFISLISLVSCSSANTNGFDQVCHIFRDASKLNKPQDETLVYISSNIDKSVPPGDALNAFHALVSVNPADRYALFKQMAESSLKHPWNCSEMKSIMDKANKPTTQK
jgi:hypothetical protein